ncbi:hypothetical protein LL999_22605 [Burkholderia ambifaria]|uniref:hypothetical protein n=1 Tax=Burkholderia ambifaria TaxID=152480 RepID=UPI001E48EDF7|nr:hypothetical protein [Burkholderia ambifaria]UEP23046.1 hypothetical protein LL999_22605 [Burkholderia ambifaria]
MRFRIETLCRKEDLSPDGPQPDSIHAKNHYTVCTVLSKSRITMKQRATRKASQEFPPSRKYAGDGETPNPAAKTRKGRAVRAEMDSAGVPPRSMERVKKEKVVRDTFTMPRSDYEKITVLMQRCLDAGVSVKKGELLRAGLILLASAPQKHLLEAVSAVERVKTGRPPKSR